MTPHRRRQLAAVLLVASIVGWPLSAIWFARNEPQFVLGLSWLALSLTALDIWATTDVRVAHDEASE